jgi:hypothetical protein
MSAAATFAEGPRLPEEIGATDEQAPADEVTHVPRGGMSTAPPRPSAIRWIAPSLAAGLVAAALLWNHERGTLDDAPVRAPAVDTTPQGANDAVTPVMTAPPSSARPAREPDVVAAPEVDTIDSAVRAQAKPPRSPASRPRTRDATPTDTSTTPPVTPDEPTLPAAPTSDPLKNPLPEPKPGKKPKRRDLKDPFG